LPSPASRSAPVPAGRTRLPRARPRPAVPPDRSTGWRRYRPEQRVHDDRAQPDGGIEGATGDRPASERRDHDGESDGESVERVAKRLHRDGRVEHHQRQRERVEQLDRQRPSHRGGRGGSWRERAPEDGVDHQCRSHGARALTDDVHRELADGRHLPAQEHGERYGRIVVAAGHMSAHVDHDHERRPDRQRRHRRFAEHR
jgi:hypothetical protein